MLFREFKNLNVFSDSNADYNQLNTIISGNEKLIGDLLIKCKLQQHNKHIINSSFVGIGDGRVIDHVYSKIDKKPYKIKNGGHLGNYIYHSAFVTTIKESANVITSTIFDKEFQKSFELSETNTGRPRIMYRVLASFF